MIDVEKMARLMESHGYRNVKPFSDYQGVPFQIVAEGKAGLVKQTILVSSIQELDEGQAVRITEDFIRIDCESRSYSVGKIFLYCLFVEMTDSGIALDLLARIRKNDRKASNLLKGGGGAIIIVDISSRKIGSYIPRLGGAKELAMTIGDLLPGPQFRSFEKTG